MTLRLPFYPQQLLFGLASFLLLILPASAQDTIIMQDGRQQPGKVLGATPSGVQIQIGGTNSITLPYTTIKEVRMAAIPPEFAQAQRAYEAKEYDKALGFLKALEKFKGLPAEWAQQATAMTGDVLVEKGDMARAEAAYKEFQKVYPTAQGGPQSEVGLARLSIAKKDFAAAKEKLGPVIEKANQEKNVSRALAFPYSQAFYLMGQIKESEGDLAGALESYLKTVTIFYYDRGAVALAQEKADNLRKEHPEVFVP